MTYDECIEILTPALLNLFRGCTVASAQELDKLLGINEYELFYKRESCNPLSDELRNLYQALAGPHAQTILKIWQIKKGLNADGTPKANCEVERGRRKVSGKVVKTAGCRA